MYKVSEVRRISHGLVVTSIVWTSTQVTAQVATEQKVTTFEPVKIEARLWQENQIESPTSSTLIKTNPLVPTDDINLLPQQVSNLALDQSSVQTRVTIRGISSVDSGLQDPVGYFINGVALPLGGNQLPAMFDLQSLEVVKGPQGALYGRNTEAGAIKINTSDPSWDLSLWGSIASGFMDGADGNSPTHVMSGGLSDAILDDQLAASIAFRVEDTQGPYFNELDQSDDGGEVERWTVSTGLSYWISDDTMLLWKSILEDNDSKRNRFRFDGGANGTDRFTTNSDTHGFDDEKLGIHSLKIEHDFASMKLIAITGITQYERRFAIDLDATSAPLPATELALDNDAVSQEIRLSSTNESQPYKWLLGAYLYDESSDIDFSISPMFMTNERNTTIDQQGQAVFGQIEYDITNHWRFTVGSRYENISQEGNQNLTNAGGSSEYSADIDHSELLPQASLSFHPNASNMIFLSYAKGYLPGGYNYSSAGDEESFTFDPEYSYSTELGWKFANPNQQFTAEVILFQVTTEDKQIVDTLPGFVQSISNAGETETYGVEVGTQYHFTANLWAYANLGWQQSEAKEYTTSSPVTGPVDLSGNELPFTPETTYALGLSLQPQLGLFADLKLRGSGDYYFNSQNTLEQSSFNIVDAEIGYHFDRLSVSLWGNNLTDEAVLSRAVSTQTGTVVEDALPQTIGIRISAKL